MNISQVIQSPRPPAQINNLYSHSSREINLVMAGNKENTSGSKMCEPGASTEDAHSSKNSSASKLARRAGSVFVEGVLTSEKKN